MNLKRAHPIDQEEAKQNDTTKNQNLPISNSAPYNTDCIKSEDNFGMKQAQFPHTEYYKPYYTTFKQKLLNETDIADKEIINKIYYDNGKPKSFIQSEYGALLKTP